MATVTTNINNNNSTSPLATVQGGTQAASIIAGAVKYDGTAFAGVAGNSGQILIALAGADVGFTSTLGPSYSSSASTSITATQNTAYITTSGSLATVTLPTTFIVGEQYGVQGQGAGQWTLKAGAGTTIQFLGSATSSGGTLVASSRYDNVRVIGLVANTTWGVMSATTAGFTVT
jgi:hypothetical protein